MAIRGPSLASAPTPAGRCNHRKCTSACRRDSSIRHPNLV